MLSDAIRVRRVSLTDSPEDIFSAAAGLLFPDDTNNSHGDPGSTVTYSSPLFGDIDLRVAYDPKGEEERGLFAHYLWNAGVWLAGTVGSCGDEDNGHVARLADLGFGHERIAGDAQGTLEEWNVKGKTVLELGAGGDT